MFAYTSDKPKGNLIIIQLQRKLFFNIQNKILK